MTNVSQPTSYRRLARGTIALVMRCSLWLGDDHLLAVKSTGYTEDYTRIYLKDLKGVVAHRTKSWLVANLILGILVALLGLGIINTDDLFSAGTITLMFMGSPFLIALLINLLQGPTCKTSLLTPLGPVEIPALTRTRRVARLIRELRPLVAARQGSMLRSELLNRYDAQRSGTGTTPTPSP